MKKGEWRWLSVLLAKLERVWIGFWMPGDGAGRWVT